jgi:small subunit ribosomal protein S17
MSDKTKNGLASDHGAHAEYLLPELDTEHLVRADRVKKKEVKIGRVVSTKSAKTIVVSVRHDFPHPKYGRRIHRDKKFHAHDEFETAGDGDIVRIVSCRPLSKLKRWTLLEIVQPARGKTGTDEFVDVLLSDRGAVAQ